MMSDQLRFIWDKTLNLLEKEVSELSFSTWFQPINPVSIEDNTIVVSVLTDFYKNTIENNFLDLLKNAVKVATKRDYTINILLETELRKKEETKYINGNGNTNNSAMFNPKYTFDSFVIGNSNKFAHAACVAVAEAMSKNYNPLFLYGEAGLGKTHLMHAIGNYVLTQNPGAKVIYAPSEKFTNELINAIKDDKTVEFRQRYRIADLLLLDDIQFIGTKAATAEEFFNTFNELYDAGKQIVISCDKKPGDLPLFEDRLRSRFEWGLTADIQPPDFETRVAILRKKAQLQDTYVPDEVMTYIAENIPSNIRKLEGALNRIIAYASLTDYDLCVDIAEEALKDIISNVTTREITSTIIINTVCKYFGLRDDEFISKKRNKEIVYPRQIAMYLCRELTGLSLPNIGMLFGGRDHTTVMHAIKKVNEGIITSSEVNRIIESLIMDIKGA